jgi:hypothetical protein
MEKQNMSLEKQIKNLQVSISIYKKEIKTIMQVIPTLKDAEKANKIARLAICEKWINLKSEQLIPLKAEYNKNKPSRQSKVNVSDTEIKEVMKKYGIK